MRLLTFLLLWVPVVMAAQRTAPKDRCFTSQAVEDMMDSVAADIADAKLRNMFLCCFPNTLDTTVQYDADSLDTFVITGDIDAMWLRDSSAQLFPYLSAASRDRRLAAMIAGAIRRQVRCLLIDPYANAFNRTASGEGWQSDRTDMRPDLHERKWELDSHCYVIRLAYNYWKATGDTSPFGAEWLRAMKTVYATMVEQQRSNGKGQYRFQRKDFVPTDTQQGFGWGAPMKPCGLIFSAFRPSDDATTFGFLVPSNMFAVVSLRQLAEMVRSISGERKFADRCQALSDEVDSALRRYATVLHPEFGTVYAYEVDGFGNHLFMDDANVPGLLSAPYLGYCAEDDSVYLNTRRMVLSRSNPYFFSGRDCEGIGGPHVGEGYAWPMGIIMRGLTTADREERLLCLRMLRDCDAGTGFMHEAVDVNNHHRFTRSWFAWANGLFGEFVMRLHDEAPELLRSSFEDKADFRCCTFNIRYAGGDDGENRWENRRDSLCSFIKAQQLDVIGMQEVLHRQLKDIMKRLPEYSCVGVAREDGATKGEYAPVLYLRSRYDLVDSGTFWLSQYPDSVGFVGWDGACCRIATWARLADKATGRSFIMMNTHMDHVGVEARRNGARLIIDRLKAVAGDLPVVLTGDMNVDAGSEAYAVLTAGDSPLADTHRIAERTAGQQYTWHAFGKLQEQRRSKIDFIFASPSFRVLWSWIPELNVRRGVRIPYMSDHNPVIVRMQ